MEQNSDIQTLVLEIAKQNILLGQRIEQVASQVANQNIALGQRIDAVSHTVVQQNALVTQSLLEQGKRFEEAKEQMRQSQAAIVEMFHQIYSALEKLPEAVKDKIGFQARS